MPVVRVLYLEDDELAFERYSSFLRMVWSKRPRLLALGDLEFDWVDTPQKALRALDSLGKEYTLLVADLLMARIGSEEPVAPVPDGLMAVEYCASRFDTICILAVSVADDTQGFPGIRDDFRAQGGDIFLSKMAIEHTRNKRAFYDKIGADIEQTLQRKNRLAAVAMDDLARRLPLRLATESLELQAQLDTIGDASISTALARLTPDCKSFSLEPVDPGLSGAFVIKVVAYLNQDFTGMKRELLLKVSRDGQRLKRELQRVPKPGLFSLGTCPALATQDTVQLDGWHAIAYEFAGGASSLHHWLTTTRPSKRRAEPLLVRLFDELGKMYVQHRWNQEGTCVDKLRPTRRVLARATVALQELRSLVERHSAGGGRATDLRLLSEFVQAPEVSSERLVGRTVDTLLCMCHGDLHSRNVLVARTGDTPVLIDFAESDEKHWASDFAELAVSLLLRGWDPGADSWEPAKLGDWRQVVDDWLLLKHGHHGRESANAPIWQSLVWIRDNVKRVWGSILNYDVPMAEFHLALAFEFLAASQQLDIPGPKRALALLAIDDILASV